MAFLIEQNPLKIIKERWCKNWATHLQAEKSSAKNAIWKLHTLTGAEDL
jgi:hypothetical protein